MITTIRAAISVLMLLGFYVLALGIIGGLAWASVWLWQEHAGSGAAKLSYITVVVAFGVLVALWRVLRAKLDSASGLPVGPDQAPQLWHTVRDLAAEAKTRAPDEILLIPDVNAAVTEDAKLLGLLGGRRRLYLGVPLLQALSVAQLRAVIAHELGHFSGQHTRLSAIAYRGRLAIQGTVSQLAGHLSGWIFKLYAKIYFLVEAAVSRRQELEADEASVRVAGRATAQGALRELPVVDAAWGFYFERYIGPGWEAGYAPRDFFGGFGRMLAARGDELERLRAAEPPSEQSKWDSHPPIAVRVAAMAAMPEVPVSVDTRPASNLLPMFDQICAALAEKEVNYGGRKVVSWDEFSAISVVTEEQRTADQVYRAAARLAGSKQADLGTVLGIVESGRLGELAEQFFPDATRKEARQRFAGLFHLLFRVAAVRSGVAHWRHSWAAAAEFARTDGAPFDLTEVANLATSPETLDGARARLADLGIDVSVATQVDQIATAHGAEIIDGLANIKVNDSPNDVLILDNGLIMVPCPKSTDNGKKRLVALARSAPVIELAKQNVFLPFEEVASAVIVKSVPIRVDLTLHDGRRLSLQETWTGESLTKESRDVLKDAVSRYISDASLPTA